MKIFRYVLMGWLCLAFWSCEDDFKAEESFTKIYDNLSANKKFFPIDIAQTSDGGYLVLAAVDTWDTYVMKTDKEGNFEWEYFNNSPYVNPVGDLIESGGKFYFFCMDKIGLFTYLMQVDPASGTVAEVAAYGDVLYPLSAAKTTSGSMLLQNYNRNNQQSGIHLIDASLGLSASNQMMIFESVEEEVVTHITRAGKRFPCFSGDMGSGKYYFNSFYNYSFSLVFVNSSDLGFSGVYNGSNYNGGVSSYLNASAGQVVSRFSFGNNFLNLNAPLNPGIIGFSDDLGGTGIAELSDNAPVKTMEMAIRGKAFLIVISETKSNKIVMFVYDPASGNLVGKKYFGNTNPYRIGDFIATSDKGIAILGQTYVNASFPRLVLFKVTEKEMETLAGFEE